MLNDLRRALRMLMKNPLMNVRRFACLTTAGLAMNGASITACAAAENVAVQVRPAVAVLGSEADSYHALAMEISQAEGCPLYQRLEEALRAQTEFLIWVASPSFLSEQALHRVSLALNERDNAPSVGIISGSTIEQARGLWLRRGHVKNSVRLHVIGTKTIVDHSRGQHLDAPQMLQSAISRADYLFYSGHGTPRAWEGLRSSELPALGPLVVATASCQTFWPWIEGSIAVSFVDNGAAAYAGFVSSPSGDYLIGENGMPFSLSWPQFPIGHIVQLQNRGTLRVFARFPQYFLLGDPRIALGNEQPYRIVSDEAQAGKRTLQITDVTAGFVPIRISGGAKYAFLRVPGVGMTWRGQRFFNARVQAIDIGDAKCALIGQTGGNLTLILEQRTPKLRAAAQSVMDFLDHRLIGNRSTTQITVIGSLFAISLVGWKLFHRRVSLRMLLTALILGVALAGLGGIHALLRVGHVTITADPWWPTLLDLSARAILVAGGFVIFAANPSWFKRTLSLLIASFPAWIVPLCLLPLVLVMGHVRPKPVVYEHHAMQYLAMGHTIIDFVFLFLVYKLAARFAAAGHGPEAAQCEVPADQACDNHCRKAIQHFLNGFGRRITARIPQKAAEHPR